MKVEFTRVIADIPPWRTGHGDYVITSREWQLDMNKWKGACCEQMYAAVLTSGVRFNDEVGDTPYGLFVREAPFARDDYYSGVPDARPIKCCPWCGEDVEVIEAKRVRRTYIPKPLAEIEERGFKVVDAPEP